MEFGLIKLNENMILSSFCDNIIKMNEKTKEYGLVLTKEQAIALSNTWNETLKNVGRIELETNIIERIIESFCDSNYINNNNYEEIMHQLIKIYYIYKNETNEYVCDEILIKYMRSSFEECKGEIELLESSKMVELVKRINSNPEKTIKELSEEFYEKH